MLATHGLDLVGVGDDEVLLGLRDQPPLLLRRRVLLHVPLLLLRPRHRRFPQLRSHVTPLPLATFNLVIVAVRQLEPLIKLIEVDLA